MKPNLDKTKAFKKDSFNLGLVLLKASNLGHPRISIKQNLDECSKSYSKSWVRFLADML